jgi:hypothetical protein
MGKSAPSPPPAPDYSGAAREQGAANIETARLQGKMSNPNIISPLGQQTVTYADDQPTVTQTLTPTATETLASQQRVQKLLANLGETGTQQAQNVISSAFAPTGTAGQELQTRLDTSGLARAPVNAGMTGQEAIMRRLQPQLEGRQAMLENQLANQGITPGSQAYRTSQTQEAQNRNDLLSQAALQGIELDTRARATGLGEQQTILGTQNAAQQAELQRQAYLRQQPLNEITGLMSGSQIQMPQFQGYQGPTVAPAPIFAGAQAQGQANMQNYGIQSANVNAQNAGLYNLLGSAGTTAAMMSDRRLKSNIERVGTHPLGIGIYEYDIFGSRQIGVMADEVEEVRPEAVMQHPSGYKMVNYGALV